MKDTLPGFDLASILSMRTARDAELEHVPTQHAIVSTGWNTRNAILDAWGHGKHVRDCGLVGQYPQQQNTQSKVFLFVAGK